MCKYVITIITILATAIGSTQAADPSVTTSTNDPLVMKIYPDGTKIVVRWSEIGKAVDNGEKHGGSPRIIAYDPGKEGIVPIGQTSSAQPASEPVSSRLQTPSSVVSPESTKSIEATPAPMSDTDNYGPMEGFGFRSNVGVAFQQSQSLRVLVDGTSVYNSITFQPGIRFDIEPFYNVTDWFSVGVESAFIYNQIHSIQADDLTIYSGDSNFGNGAFYQVPILANVRFQFPTDGPFRGFCGGGVGGVWDFLTISAAGENGTSYQWNYTFQLATGFTYNVAPGLDLETSFKALCTPNPLGEGADSQTKASYNYTAEVGLAYRF
jgi:opacity protein-like surface antigen